MKIDFFKPDKTAAGYGTNFDNIHATKNLPLKYSLHNNIEFAPLCPPPHTHKVKVDTTYVCFDAYLLWEIGCNLHLIFNKNGFVTRFRLRNGLLFTSPRHSRIIGKTYNVI